MGITGQIMEIADKWIDDLDASNMTTDQKLEILKTVGEKVNSTFGDLSIVADASAPEPASEAPEPAPPEPEEPGESETDGDADEDPDDDF